MKFISFVISISAVTTYLKCYRYAHYIVVNGYNLLKCKRDPHTLPAYVMTL